MHHRSADVDTRRSVMSALPTGVPYSATPPRSLVGQQQSTLEAFKGQARQAAVWILVQIRSDVRTMCTPHGHSLQGPGHPPPPPTSPWAMQMALGGHATHLRCARFPGPAQSPAILVQH